MWTRSIAWVALWSGVTIAGAAGVVSSNSLRFHRRVSGEARDMFAAAATGGPASHAVLASLPDPVRRYLSKAIDARRDVVRAARLRLEGTFRPDLNGRWYPLQAMQYFAADPPGFIWWGRVQLAPGIWIDARDRSVNGAGNMLIMAESTIRLNDARGPELDQGALLRLLGELVWLPAVYLDDRYVRWSPVDQRHAKATLAVGDRQVTGVFEFGEDDLPMKFTAERFRDIGGGKSVLTPFAGDCRDYRAVDGFVVPHEVVAFWIIDGTPAPYARFHVVRLEFDRAEPF